MENSLKREKILGKFCTKMPLVPTGQEFRTEHNVAIFPWKLVGRIFGSLRNNWKILYLSVYCPTGQEFWPEYIVGIFELKLADRIFSDPRKKWKILLKEKKIRLNFVQKRP